MMILNSADILSLGYLCAIMQDYDPYIYEQLSFKQNHYLCLAVND